jgi:hypothetical protein
MDDIPFNPKRPPPLYWETAELGLDESGRVFKKGGPRPNAGRKPSGRKAYCLRLKPEAFQRLSRQARAAGHRSLAAYLESLGLPDGPETASSTPAP